MTDKSGLLGNTAWQANKHSVKVSRRSVIFTTNQKKSSARPLISFSEQPL